MAILFPTSTGGSITGTSASTNIPPGYVRTTGATSTPGSVLTVGSAGAGTGASTFWGIPHKTKSTIAIANEDGDSVELDYNMLLDLALLLQEINEAPDEHPLAEIKQALQVRRAFRTLGKS